eukprot:scpid28634/ scgid21686/ Beta-mannosidase; Lysosomal beta A mannosidase; Mannanase
MYERRSGQRLLLLLAVLVCANAADLRDIPLAGDYASYLDGTWTAIGQTRGDFNGCNFEENIDYNHALSSGSTSSQAATSKEECCSLCSEMAGCASGVFHSSKCYFKTAQDLLSPSSQPGHVACTPHWLAGNTITLPNATVPGDLITDLEMAGKVGDPLYELNFKNATLWGFGVWNYTKTIKFTDMDVKNIAGYSTAGSDVVLVFDGIKMGANIYMNGKLLGTANDQFLRYNFSLGQAMNSGNGGNGLQVQVGDNKLVVSFDASIDTGGRFMACTGGWDWAPYTTTLESSTNSATFTRGIWKSVYLVTVNGGGAAIEHVIPQIFYTGPYPTAPLPANEHSDFKVDVIVKFYAPRASEGTLSVHGEWGSSEHQHISLTAGSGVSHTVSLTASAKNISLWWPSGLGPQPLYTIAVSYTADSAHHTHDDTNADATAVSTIRKVGFRYVALVTGNDTDPSYVKKASTSQTTADFGMYFRVNGAVVFNRGANMIPMEELEGRMNAVAFSRLVQSAVDGRMNMLRVWGGGIFLPDIWYDECDRLGIMVYHDMQYAQNGHSPSNNPVQDAELRHQIRRLSHHPCIVVWDGCNECRVKMGTATGIYATFVMTVVMQEDKSRPIWPSCPAIGWTAGVHALDATPTGDVLTTPNDARSIETHGPYQHGGGFPSVNGDNRLVLFPSNIPIKVSQIDTGVALQNVFASEFGCSVFSSFESMSPTLHPSHWGVHAGLPPDNCTGGFHSRCSGNNPMAERNYACDNIIQVYFGENDKLDSVGEAIFKQQLYHCILGQALVIKSNIETRRSTNQFGIVVWQYNEIWPTGGWGSIEYGTPRPGQVIGGRWKPLHYFYRQSIFTDVTVACGGDGLCYVKNDIAKAFSGTVVISAIAFANAQVTTLESKTLSLATGPGVTEWIQVDFSKINPADQVITATIMNADKEVVCDNVIPLTEPYKMKLLKANVKVSVGSKNPGGSVDIHLTTDHVAMYVTVTTLAAGRFSDNALLLLPAGKTVQFLPFSDTVDMSLLQSSIRVEDISLYM